MTTRRETLKRTAVVAGLLAATTALRLSVSRRVVIFLSP